MDNIKQFVLNEIKEKRISIQEGKEIIEKLSPLSTSDEPVAVIGMSQRLPQADTLQELRQNLLNKIDSIRTFPEKRRVLTDPWLPDVFCETEDPYQKQGYLDDISLFDESFFNLSVAEAKKMHPIQRLFMMCTYEALEDAGYGGDTLRDTKTAIYVGNAQMGELRYKDFSKELDGTGFVGSANSMIPSRIAYFLGLKGPGMIVDSACSSGLLGVHMACESLKSKRIDYAIACGATINLLPLITEKITIMESPNSVVSPFDEKANGTVWGEGIGVVILKRANDAVIDGDHIYTLIRGSGVNNNGASSSLTALDANAQQKLFESVWEKNHIDPASIIYVEAHGTGTEIGDAIEVKSLSRAFATYTDQKQFCGIGTSKCNIGHIIGASGTAALIKIAQSFSSGEVPPIQRFDYPNQYIDFSKSALYIADQKIAISKNNPDSLIAINSFGINGTNVHMVLSNPKEDNTDEKQIYRMPLFISAKNPESLLNLIERYIIYLADTESNLEDICYTAWIGRDHYKYRAAAITNSKDDLKHKLSSLYTSIITSGTACTDIYYFEDNKNYPSSDEISFHCISYIKGQTINARNIFTSQAKRTSIPTYPFDLQSRWVDSPSTTLAHPVIGRPVLISENEEHYDIALDVRGWRINEYSIGGRKALSASAIIEIIYQIVYDHYSGMPICFEDLQLNIPVYADSFSSLNASLTKSPNYIQMEIYGLQPSQLSKTLLAQVSICSENEYPISIVSNDLPESPPPTIQNSNGRWNCIECFSTSEEISVFDICLPSKFSSDMETHQLHPALFDVATTAMFVSEYGECYAIGSKKITQHRPLPSQFKAIVKKIHEMKNDIYDIILQDHDGIITTIKGYRLTKTDNVSDNMECKLSLLAATGQSKLTGYKENDYSVYEKVIAAIWCEVLGCKSVDIDSDFFSLGGDSIMAITIANNLTDVMNYDIEPIDLLQNLSIRQLGEFVQNKRKPKEVLKPAPMKDFYPLSKEQLGIYMYSILNPQSTVYNLSTVLEISGDIDVNRLEKAFCRVVEENESLRTKYIVLTETPEQSICSVDNYTMTIRRMDHPLVEGELNQLFESFNKPFDLECGILLRTWLVQDGDNHGYLFIGTHHIAADGRSMTILFEDYIGLYTDGVIKKKRRKYVDYATFSISNSNPGYNDDCQYWRTKFSSEFSKLDLPTDFENTSKLGYRGDVLECVIDAAMVNTIKEKAVQWGVTASSIMMSAFSIVLYKYSGQKDFVIGMPYAGREYKDLENVIGMFVHTLPIRIQAAASKRVTDFIQAVHLDCLSSMQHAGFHTGNISKDLGLEYSSSHGSLYNVMFTFQNTGGRIEITDVVSPRIELSLDGLQVNSLDFKRGVARSDLMLEIVERNQEYICLFEYSSELFRTPTVSRMAKCLQETVKQMLQCPQVELATIDIISDDDRNRILHKFNGPIIEIPEEMGVIPAFRNIVATYPQKTALIANDACYSYQELDELSDRIMAILAKKGIHGEQPVIMHLQRSPILLAAILGVWKNGSSYIPVDVNYPIERITHIHRTSSAQCIITLGINVTPELNQEFSAYIVVLDEELAINKDNIPPIADYEKNLLAYTIFTSGSTGTPKGAMIEHAGMFNHITAKIHELNMNADTVIAATASPCFDISVWQFFSVLCIGGTVVVFNESDINDVTAFIYKITNYKINILEIVPGYLAAMLDALTDQPAVMEQLSFLIVTGDVVEVMLVNRWLDMFPNIPIVNAYGPTEASDDITHCIISEKLTCQMVPVGKTLQNLNIYIVNDENHLCPIGVKGEICVSGIGVGRGYINNIEQTERVFGIDPFVAQPRRMYHTGDVGCWLDDGTLKIFGRMDHQVKIRGFRIELNEITSNIISCLEVHEAVTVVLGETDHKYLCSYYTAETGPIDDVIFSSLRKRLPEYMIPTVLVFLKEMPHNDNGKIDRKLLPIPEQAYSDEKKLMPVSAMEKAVCHSLESVLDIAEVGLNQNFYSLGGDSIKAIQFTAKLRQAGYAVDIQNLLSVNTISELIPYVSEIVNEEAESLKGFFNLSYLQEKYIEMYDLIHTHWNQNIAVSTHYSIDENIVYNTLIHLVKGHDSLRLHFTRISGTYMQEYSQDADKCLQVDHVKVGDDIGQITQYVEQLNNSVNLETGKNIGCLIVNTENDTILVFAINHLLVDPMSFRIIIDDFFSTYHTISAGGPAEKIQKTNSYKKYLKRSNELFHADMICDHYKYYEQYFRRFNPQAIFQEPGVVRHSDALETVFDISETLSNHLRGAANKAYGTNLEILLLSGLAMALSRVYKKDCGCIFLESDLRFADIPLVSLSRSVGWFAAEFPVIFNHTDSVENTIICIKENLRLTPWGGACYAFSADRLAAEGYVFPADILFNYMGNFDPIGLKKDYTMLSAMSGISIGNSAQMAYGLEVNAGILGDRIKFSFVYNPQKQHAQSVLALQEVLIDSLEQITAFCCSQDNVTVTPSDFNNSYITRNDLEYIETYIRDVIVT